MTPGSRDDPRRRAASTSAATRQEEISLAVGKVLGRYKMGKHLQLTIEEDRFDWQRKPGSIEREAALDGIYVIRTSVPASNLTGPQVVATYKSLSTVERFSQHEKRGSESETDSSSPPRAGKDPCVVVHAGLLREVAYAPGAGAGVIR